MRCPALVPALGVLAGVLWGSLAPASAQVPAAVALVAGWVGAVAAFRRGASVVVLGAAGVGFVGAGALVAAPVGRATLAPPLRAALESVWSGAGARIGPVVLEGRLLEDAAPSAEGASLRLAVARVVLAGRDVAIRGNVRLTVGGAFVDDRIDDWRAGRALRVPAALRRPLRYLNPGVPDQELALARRGTVFFGSVKSAALVEVTARGAWPAELAAEARAAVRRAVARHVGPLGARSAGIVTAILIGDRAGLDEETERRLQDGGTYHVIAISGGNIAILAGFLLLVLRLAGAPPGAAGLVTMTALVGYAWVVGGGASVVRATLIASAYLAARAADHRAEPLNALAVALVVILCASPFAVFDVGFALTFGATLAILVGVPRALGWVRGVAATREVELPRWALAPLALFAATLAAEAALLPVAAAAFSRVSFAGLVLNFLAIPLMTVIQIAGLALVALASVAEPFARSAAALAHAATTGLVESTRLVDALPWLVRRVPPPPAILIGAYYGGLAAALAPWRRPALRRAGIACAAGALVMLLAGQPAGLMERSDRLRVTFLDVGQGDAALVRFPGGRSLLVDAAGGPGRFDVGSRIVAPAVWALGVRRLDYLALTHGDPDHIAGAPAVLRDFRPREVWEGVPVPAHDPMRLVERDARARGSGWRVAQAGDRLRVGDVEIRVSHPPPPDWERQAVRNDDSLVLELVVGHVSIVLTGDVGRAVEPAVAAALGATPFRVVKVPHHGSAGSSSPAFVAAAKPRVAVVSAGRGNLYGHPRPEVLQRYRDAGAAIFRTDEDGAVTVETDGQVVEVHTRTGRYMHARIQ